MDINNLENIVNNNYIVLLPGCNYNIRNSVEFSFENVVNIENTDESEIEKLIKFINKEVKQLIIFNFDEIYRKILPYIKKSIIVKCVYSYNLAKMTDGNIRAIFNNIMEFYDRKIIMKIGCTDFSTFNVLNNAKYNVEHVILDIKQPNKREQKKQSKTIGLLGNDYDPNHNTYNQLSAIKMVDYDKIKIIKNMPATEHFINFFNIKEQHVNSMEEVLKDNFVNLYANFTGTDYNLVLESMDVGIPCILGNTDFFDEYPELKEKLVLNSDDDISEISEKINNAKLNGDKIIELYKEFRKKYSENSKKSVIDFTKN